MEAFTRNTTQGMQVTVFDSFELRQVLKDRGYTFGKSLPRPAQTATGGWRYGAVEAGWVKWPVIQDEVGFLQELGMTVRHITQDKNGAIADMREHVV